MLTFDKIVFGPIHSRRLGASLGINLLPLSGKLCNFNCIYCECGLNEERRTNEAMPSFESVSKAIEAALADVKMRNVKVDSITFAGDGEPTLHPDFPAIVDLTISLRDRYCPGASVSVLTNATMLDRPGVTEALMKVDNPILKLDAPTDALAAEINQPNGNYSVKRVVDGMLRFNGNFILQTMFLKGAPLDYETDYEALAAWMDIVRLTHPRKVTAYTLDRPAPLPQLEKMSIDKMKELLRPLVEDGFEIETD